MREDRRIVRGKYRLVQVLPRQSPDRKRERIPRASRKVGNPRSHLIGWAGQVPVM